MSSSDSEDDYYTNVAQKLQVMKDKYKFEYTDTTELNDSKESVDLDEIIKNANNTQKRSVSEDVLFVTDESIKPSCAATRRVTRASIKKANTESSPVIIDGDNLENTQVEASLTTTCNVRGKSRRGKRKMSKRNEDSATQNTNTSVPNESVQLVDNVSLGNTANTRSKRGKNRASTGNVNTVPNVTSTRNRGNARRGRGRRSGITHNHSNVSVISIGNTSEYPDPSESQPLFNKPQNNDFIILEDNDALDENEELSVKVYWQSSEFYKFKIRKYQKLTQIFNYFSNLENICYDKLLFTYNDRILRPDDTPDSISYSIVKFIDGGIVQNSVSDLVKGDKQILNSNMKIKFQFQNTKKPIEIFVTPDEKLMVAMIKCAEHLEKPLQKLKFEFDGDNLSGTSTLKELEFEGDECIDVKLLS